MTIQKVAKEIQTSMDKIGIREKPTIAEIVNILSGLAILVDYESDPDCIYTNKVNVCLNDLARDIRKCFK